MVDRPLGKVPRCFKKLGAVMAIMKVDGGCHCGRVTYEAEIDLEKVVICHCEDCKSFSGSEFRGAAPALWFKLTGEAPHRYLKTAASGHVNAMLLCPNCGSHVCSTGSEPDSKFFGVRWGTTRQRAQIKPVANIFCRSAHDWVWDISSLPRMDKG
jgi:hypothetical protein